MNMLKLYNDFIEKYDKKDFADQIEDSEIRSAIFDDIVEFVSQYEEEYEFIVEVDEGSDDPSQSDFDSLVVYTLFKPLHDILWTKVGLKISRENGFEIQEAITGVHVEYDEDKDEDFPIKEIDA